MLYIFRDTIEGTQAHTKLPMHQLRVWPTCTCIVQKCTTGGSKRGPLGGQNSFAPNLFLTYIQCNTVIKPNRTWQLRQFKAKGLHTCKYSVETLVWDSMFGIDTSNTIIHSNK